MSLGVVVGCCLVCKPTTLLHLYFGTVCPVDGMVPKNDIVTGESGVLKYF